MKKLCFMFAALAVSVLLLCTACGGGGGGGGGGAPAPAPAADGATSGTGSGTGGSGTSGGTASGKTLVAEKWISLDKMNFNGASAITGSSVFISGRNITTDSNNVKFVMSSHEVTQAEYEKYCTYGSSKPSDSNGKSDNHPAYYVSWYDALVYCNKRSMAEGKTPCYTIKSSTDPAVWGTVPTTNDTDWNNASCNFAANGYRLPTEAEWEYAARGGNLTNSGQTKYAGSDTIGDVAWYYENSDSDGTGRKSHAVETKKKNNKGLYDMSGNVWEWCWDWYDGAITTTTPATGSASGSSRVMRGGCWDSPADFCAVSCRSSYSSYGRVYYVGFRVVRSGS